MKVTVCLNPVHSATGPLGVALGYDLFAYMLNTDEDMMKMAEMVFSAEPSRLLIAAAVGIVLLLLVIIKFKIHPVLSLLIGLGSLFGGILEVSGGAQCEC